MTRVKEKVDTPQFTGSLDCNAVQISDELLPDPRHGWIRVVTYRFGGEEYSYGMEPIGAMNPEVARAKLDNPKVLPDTQRAFLRDVELNTGRPN